MVPVGLDAGTAATPAGEVPPGVQKLPEAAGAKSNKYFCDTCNVSLNSEIQLEQVSHFVLIEFFVIIIIIVNIVCMY